MPGDILVNAFLNDGKQTIINQYLFPPPSSELAGDPCVVDYRNHFSGHFCQSKFLSLRLK